MNKLQRMISVSNYIVFLSGQGMNEESEDNHSFVGNEQNETESNLLPEFILNSKYFSSHTEEFYAFYKKNVIKKDAMPNEAHKKLCDLENTGKLKAIITVNTDSLHKEAGSKKVYELHGSTKKNYCIKCNACYDEEYILKSDRIPLCECGGLIKPGVVLFDEALCEKEVDEAIEHIKKADLLIIAGTSLTSYPATAFLGYFHGQYLALINKEEGVLDKLANYVSHEKIEDELSKISIM